MKRYLLLSAFVFGCGEKLLDPLDPSSFPQYSGTATVEVGKDSHTYEYYRDGAKIRIVPRDAQNPTTDKSVAIIIDTEARTSTVVLASTKQYYIRSTATPSKSGPHWMLQQGHTKPIVLSRQDIGTESVAGHPCLVQQVMLQASDGKQHSLKLWSARDLQGFPLRIDVTEGAMPVSITFTDISLSRPSDTAIFSIPTGFSRIGNSADASEKSLSPSPTG